MSDLAISLLTLGLVFGGALVGHAISIRLPHHHLQEDSRDVVKVAVGLTATLSAVLLSLLIASAKNFYDAQTMEVEQLAGKVVLLDRVLAHYGPETGEIRKEFQKSIAAAIDRIWPTERGVGGDLSIPRQRGAAEAFFTGILELSPRTDAQKLAQVQAIQISVSLGEIRMLMFSQRGNMVPSIFIAILLIWVVALFLGFGLLTRINPTVVTVLFVGATLIASAVFLILELNHPYEGMIQIPSTVMRDALAQMGRS
ncbi:MAG: hypothetical protein ACM3O6_03230 [Acidobacteriota bacterium]